MIEAEDHKTPSKSANFGISLDGPIVNFVYPVIGEMPPVGSRLNRFTEIKYTSRRFLKEVPLVHPITGEAQMPFGLTRAEYELDNKGEVKGYNLILRPEEDDKQHKALADFAKNIPKLNPKLSLSNSLFMLFPTLYISSTEGLEFALGLDGVPDGLGPLLRINNNPSGKRVEVNEFVANLLKASLDPFGPRIASFNDSIPPFNFEMKTFSGIFEKEGIEPEPIPFTLYAGVSLDSTNFEDLDRNIKDIIKMGKLSQDSLFQFVRPYARMVTDELSRS